MSGDQTAASRALTRSLSAGCRRCSACSRSITSSGRMPQMRFICASHPRSPVRGFTSKVPKLEELSAKRSRSSLKLRASCASRSSVTSVFVPNQRMTVSSPFFAYEQRAQRSSSSCFRRASEAEGSPHWSPLQCCARARTRQFQTEKPILGDPSSSSLEFHRRDISAGKSIPVTAVIAFTIRASASRSA